MLTQQQSNMVEFSLGNIDKELNDVINFCSLWWKETGMSKLLHIPYKPDIELFKKKEFRDNYIAILGRDNGQLVAAYVGLISPYIFNKDLKCCTEILWGVHPKYRNGTTAYRLLNTVNDYMKALHIDICSIATLDLPEFKHSNELVKKHNYQSMNTLYLKKV